MKKILAFGASNSRNSINKKFAVFAANQLKNVDVTVADLNEYALPVYSIDLERESGIHENATRFYALIQAHDAIVISVAEYNGLHTSAFKNLWDWLSRIPMEKPMNVWDGKPMLLLSTSPSRRPMNNVLKVSKEIFPHFGAHIISDFYLPSFNHFFKEGAITDLGYREEFNKKLVAFNLFLDEL